MKKKVKNTTNLEETITKLFIILNVKIIIIIIIIIIYYYQVNLFCKKKKK